MVDVDLFCDRTNSRILFLSFDRHNEGTIYRQFPREEGREMKTPEEHLSEWSQGSVVGFRQRIRVCKLILFGNGTNSKTSLTELLQKVQQDALASCSPAIRKEQP